MTLRTRTLLFAAYSLCLMAVSASALRALIDLSRHNETSSHLILIPFVAAALIFTDREPVFSSIRPAWLAGCLTILGGLGLLVAGQTAGGDSLSLLIGAFAICWVGGFLLCYGTAAFRAALFPLLFLGFMIPVPPQALAGATQFLKAGSTEAVAWLFTLTGTPYHRDGFVFSLPHFVIEVADECSGIRSSIALLLTALLAAHLYLKTWWKKALLAGAIVPFAILKNGIRIVTLSLLAEHVDPGYLTGQLHHEGGIVFFVFTLVMIAPFLVLLHRSDMKRNPGVLLS